MILKIEFYVPGLLPCKYIVSDYHFSIADEWISEFIFEIDRKYVPEELTERQKNFLSLFKKDIGIYLETTGFFVKVAMNTFPDLTFNF